MQSPNNSVTSYLTNIYPLERTPYRNKASKRALEPAFISLHHVQLIPEKKIHFLFYSNDHSLPAYPNMYVCTAFLPAALP